MARRGATERLKAWLLPDSCLGWILAAFLLVLVFLAWAYSARDYLYRTYQGMQPGADPGPAFAAGAKPELEETSGGARVTLNWVYAEEEYVSVGFEVEDLEDGRSVAGHPAELQPILGDEEPTRREKEYLEEHGLGTAIVDLTDESGTDFRMVDNSGATSEGPDNMVRGPLENEVAFEPERRVEPSKKHRFHLEIPLYESAVVSPEEKQPPPEPFGGESFVFDFEVPVHRVRVVEVDQKTTARGVTLTLDRVIDSPGRPRAVICYAAPDDEHSWYLYGGEGVLEEGWSTSGWSGGGQIRVVPPAKCQKLMLEGPVEEHSSVEVEAIEGTPRCPSDMDETVEACLRNKKDKMIHGPWRFEFDVPDN